MSGGPLSYEPFFGLKKKPFSLASDPEFLYESPSHSAALLALLAGIRRREGLLAFTGDVGTGKTTICRAVLRNLDRTTFSTFIPDPFASREDMLRMLLIDFGVATVADITTGPLAQAGRAQLSYLLSSFLDTLVPLDAFVVVFIDEAQNMSLSLLEEVRVLSDAFNRHGQLQVVFVGQLELLDKLKSPTMRQLDQRVSVYTQLDPLNAGDVVGYVHHRLQMAGASPQLPMFAPTALSLLHDVSGGIPRVINRLCDRALHLAYERRSPLIDRDIMAEAVDHSPGGMPRAFPDTTRRPLPAGGEDIVVNSVPLLTRETPVEFATKVDVWLSQLDGPVPGSAVAAAESAPPISLPTTSDEPSTVATAPDFLESPLRRRRPQRYIERLARRWTRAAVLALAAFVGLNAIVAATSYMPAQITPRFTSRDLPPLPMAPPPRLAPIAAPATPAPAEDDRDAARAAVVAPAVEDQYFVAVGAFSTRTRATVLVDTLAQRGFNAFTRTLQLRTRALQQVLLGPFEAPSTAFEELMRLRAAGNYVDARVMALPPVSN